jgi:hypothetical protein
VLTTPWYDLLHLADRYQFDTLSVICQTRIAQRLNTVSSLMALENKFPGLSVQALTFCARCVVVIYTTLRDAKAMEMADLWMRAIVERLFEQVEDRSAMACWEIMHAMWQLYCLCSLTA